RMAARLADQLARAGVRVGRTGGSDAHTIRRIGWAWTEADADNREAFLEALRKGRGNPGGVSGTMAPVVKDVYQVVLNYYADVIGNRFHHFSPGQRTQAAFCSLVSLPLQLVALPALGTLFRRFRVRRASLRYAGELD